MIPILQSILRWIASNAQMLGTLLGFLTGIIEFISSIFQDNRTAVSILATGSSLALVSSAAIADPDGAINAFMINVIDVILRLLPSTPDGMKIGILLQNLIAPYPLFAPFITQAFMGAIQVISFAAALKLIKFLPFL